MHIMLLYDMLLIYDEMYCVTEAVLGNISLEVTYDCGGQ